MKKMLSVLALMLLPLALQGHIESHIETERRSTAVYLDEESQTTYSFLPTGDDPTDPRGEKGKVTVTEDDGSYKEYDYTKEFRIVYVGEERGYQRPLVGYVYTFLNTDLKKNEIHDWVTFQGGFALGYSYDLVEKTMLGRITDRKRLKKIK